MKAGRLNQHLDVALSNRNHNLRGTRKNRSEKIKFTISALSPLICVFLIANCIACVESSTVPVKKGISFTTSLHSADGGESDSDLESKDNSSVCLTPGCVLIAAEYLQRANFSGDPCGDFYNYACGGYEANTVIPEQETSKTSFQAADEVLNNRLKTMLENPDDTKESQAFGKVSDFYQACTNTSLINSLKEKPLRDVLKLLGGWPVVEGSAWTKENEDKFDWTQIVYALKKLGINYNYIADLSVTEDAVNSSKYIIEIDEPSLGMPGRSYLLKGFNDSIVQHYLDFMVEIATLMGADPETAKAELSEAVMLEISIAKLTLPKEERRNYTQLYNKKTIAEVNKLSPIVNWVEYANNLLEDKIDENENVIYVSPTYLGNITTLLNNTSKRTLANYLMWRVSMTVLGMLDDRFRASLLKYTSSITGQTLDEPRWKICLASARSYFGIAIGAMYVRRYLSKKDRDLAINLVKGVRNEFRDILETVDWMDSVTLKRAIKKAEQMEQMIGYPLELLNNTLIDEHYTNITVNKSNFFETSLKMKKEWSAYRARKLRQTRTRGDWREAGAVAVVNAFYSPQQNLIMFPAGILQGVFFGSDRPRYINYGAIGFVIGHEITHGFDDQGRQFDGVGNLQGWWEKETDEKFQNKTKCIIDQYSEYNMTEVNMTINGINTQGENVADNGGVKEAYKGYMKWKDENGEEKLLPGIDLTTRQLFWLSFANVWCSKTRPEALKFRILTGVHSPQKFRVNGVVSNSKEFARDFNCPLGSPMNPQHKCEVW